MSLGFDYKKWRKNKKLTTHLSKELVWRLNVIRKKEREIMELQRKWNMIELKDHSLFYKSTRSKKNKDRKIFLDCETTGFYNSDGIVEISLLEVLENKYTGNYIHCYFNPLIEVSEGAEKIHGLNLEKLKDKPIFGDKLIDIINFIGDSKMVAHNSNFDKRMLNNELNRNGFKSYSDDSFIDTLHLARNMFPNQKNTLDCLCERFNIDNSKRKESKLHNAFDDTLLLLEVYKKLKKF